MSKFNPEKEREELEKLLGKKLPEDLNQIGMEYFSEEEFQELFGFIEFLISVKERIRAERKQKILQKMEVC